jgi:hypothetical protein
MCRVSRDQVFFDTFNRLSTRSVYNWALPMGSRLYSESEVLRLLHGAGLRLREDDHDFLLPYGFYREMPNSVAEPLREADRTVGETTVGQRLASVSYWDASVE